MNIEELPEQHTEVGTKTININGEGGRSSGGVKATFK